MIKKRILACSLIMAMIPSFSVLAEESVYIDLTADSDMFITASVNMGKAYADDLYYYDGAQFADGIIEFDGIDYRLYSDKSAMNGKVNDVVKIDGDDVEITMSQNAAKAVGLMLFTRESVSDNIISVSVNYENGSSESYDINVLSMTDSENSVSAGLPIEVVKQSAIMYKSVEVPDVSAYLHSCVIDISQSVNKSSALKSITLPDADFVYYLAAVTQVNYSESELEDFTQQIIKDLYGKYADLNFVQLAEGENGTTLAEAEELKQSLISQLGKTEEATEENIEKISLLIEGCKLYQTVIDCREGISESEEKYLDISADFTDLSDTSLTDADFAELGKLIKLYENYENLDRDRLCALAEHYGVEIDIDVDLSNRDKIVSLYNAYEKAQLKSELKTEIEKYYNTYIGKDISEITENDEPALTAMLDAFLKAEEAGIDMSEYDSGYIKHLYSDYKNYSVSEDGYAVDISADFDADSIADAGDKASTATWYECNDNISGSKILNATHGNISSYDSTSGIIKIKEYEYAENDSESAPYKFNATGYNIPFVMPSSGLTGGVCDTVLFGANSDKSYTVDMNSVYADKIYLLMSGAESEISVTVLYNDGTEEIIKFNIHTTAQLVDKVKTMGYANLTGYITSGDYGNYNLGSDGVIYRNSGNVTNGIGVFAIEPNSQKGAARLTFKATSKDFALYGISVMPESNSAVSEYTLGLYNEIVTDGGVDTSDKDKTAQLVLAYNECTRRGLYIPEIDSSVLAELENRVLTASGNVYRKDIDTVKAEIEFSVEVDEASAKSAITVTADGTAVSDYTVSFDGTKMTVDIPVTKEGTDNLTVKVDSTVKIKAYPNIAMMYPFTVSTAVAEYITAEYAGGNMNITNNSFTPQDYIAFVCAEDSENIYDIKTAFGTVDGRVSISMPVWEYPEGASVNAAVLDAVTLSPLKEITAVPVCGDEPTAGASYENSSFDLETRMLTINGFTPSQKSGRAVSVLVSASGTDVYCGIMKTAQNGYFSFNIPIGADVPTGTLEIKVGGDDFTAYVSNNSISISDDNTKTNFVNGIINAASADEVYTLLSRAESVLSISFEPFDYVIANMPKSLAERIYSQKGELEAITDGDEEIGRKSAALQKLIKQQSVLECIENGVTELYAEGGDLLYDELMGYSSIDSDGVTLYSLYKTAMSEQGRKTVINTISKKNYDDCESLYSELREAIMLNALVYPSSNGTGFVKNVLTKANADAVGITITKYLKLTDKSEASVHIANMSISSLKDVTDYISTLSSSESGGSSGGGGGSSSGSVSLNPISIYPVEGTVTTSETTSERAEFSDLPSSHWGYNSVMKLYEAGVINGYGDGTFGTDKTITRAEFVKLVCLIKGIEADGYENIFSDVTADKWYAPYVCTAYKAGLVNGISDTEFGAEKPVSRQDICVILFRSDNIVSESQPAFADNGNISDYALGAVGYFSEKGIVNGFDGNVFRPLENASRVQAAQIIYNYTTAE